MARSSTWAVRRAVGMVVLRRHAFVDSLVQAWAVPTNSLPLTGGVTTAVTPATRSTTWGIIGRVVATRATTWNVLTPVEATRDTTWDVLTPVEATRATTWNIVGPVTAATRATTWDVLAPVAATRATTWDVLSISGLSFVEATRATTWDVVAAVAASRATTWRVLSRVTASRSTTWVTIGPIVASRSTTWNTVGPPVIASRSTTWDIVPLPRVPVLYAKPPRGARWEVTLLDPRSGFAMALEGWQSISVTENFDGVSATLTMSALAPEGRVVMATGFVHELITDILMRFDHKLVYRFRVVDSEDTLTTEDHTVSFTLVDYRALLARRILFADQSTVMDQHLWAWRLIDYTQHFDDLGIRPAPDFGPAGQNRDRIIQRGQTILEAVNELASTDNGFDWWIDEHLLLHAQTPRRLNDMKAGFAWGAEVAALTRSNPIDAYSSVVFGIGATGTTTLPGGYTYPPPTPVIRELASQPYGRWERTAAYSDIVTQESLIQKTLWNLADSALLRPQYNVSLEPEVWTPAIRPGGIFTLRARSRPRLDFRVVVRVETVSLTLDANGLEVVSLGCRAEGAELDLNPQPRIPVTPLPAPRPLASRSTTWNTG